MPQARKICILFLVEVLAICSVLTIGNFILREPILYLPPLLLAHLQRLLPLRHPPVARVRHFMASVAARGGKDQNAAQKESVSIPMIGTRNA